MSPVGQGREAKRANLGELVGGLALAWIFYVAIGLGLLALKCPAEVLVLAALGVPQFLFSATLGLLAWGQGYKSLCLGLVVGAGVAWSLFPALCVGALETGILH